ncbi:MAG: DUF1127 domain-containing protein [Pseudolabrys sp.]
MTYLGTHFPIATAPHGDFGARSTGVLARIWQSIHRLVLIGRRRRELYRLPDRVLRDIGLHRSEIEGITANLPDDTFASTRIARGR